MKQRFLTGIILLVIVFFPFYFGGMLLRALVFAACALSAYELIELRKGRTKWGLIIFVFLSIIAFYNLSDNYMLITLSFFLIILFMLTIFVEDIQVTDICYIFTISVILSLAAKSLIVVYDQGYSVLLYLAMACYGCDFGAYIFGYFFGKHKMIERISPKKTWEGAIGGWATGFIGSLIFAYFMIDTISFELLFLCSLLLPIVAQIGDLSFSAIKRYYGVKDFGTIFPGHGGVLDRIDSLVFCLMFFNAFLMMVI
ncbi:MAG: phosphatidate cytidylyltransferase [Erysipelotrichaceae bacterium]|nr:phosphatidate cytidylyltransferase [Erysipelotrichaceae bacterium]MDY5252706.1 phosphatidate cytidylyltransferase [Erysipelotrichaceae bacterium]